MDSIKIKRSDLKEGQRFWNFENNFGDPDTEAIIRDGVQVWADGSPTGCVSLLPDSFVYAKPEIPT